METRTADPARDAAPAAPVAPPPREAPTAPTATADRQDELTGRLADQLLGLSRRLHRAQRRRLDPLGVTPAQARLLRALGHWEEPPRMADLAQRLDVVPRAVTTLVDALEERGVVRRAPDPRNRRVIRIELTEGGLRALDELRRARRAAAAEILAPLDDPGRAALTRLLAVLDSHDQVPGHRADHPPHG
jgi:DNA-binding MarR family transcriptional regulator